MINASKGNEEEKMIHGVRACHIEFFVIFCILDFVESGIRG